MKKTEYKNKIKKTAKIINTIMHLKTYFIIGLVLIAIIVIGIIMIQF